MKNLIGTRVRAISSEYEGLEGEVFDVKSGEEKETCNPGIDIYVSFDIPKGELKESIEKEFSVLYGEPKEIDDIILDFVVMSMDMLEFLL